MSFITQTLALATFKRLLGKSHTSDSRDPANEAIPSNFSLAAQNIFANKINPIPENNTNVVSDLITLYLEPISGTANSGKYAAYRTKLGSTVPNSLNNKINRLTGNIYQPYDYVGDIIPQSFGENFRPKLFKNSNETPPLDASDWFVDCSAGVVSQEEDIPANMIDYSSNGTLQCYIYIGNFVSDVLTTQNNSFPVFHDLQTLGNGISGLQNGINNTFTLDYTPVISSIHLYFNGILNKDFSVSGKNIIFGNESIPVETDNIIISYRSN